MNLYHNFEHSFAQESIWSGATACSELQLENKHRFYSVTHFNLHLVLSVFSSVSDLKKKKQTTDVV